MGTSGLVFDSRFNTEPAEREHGGRALHEKSHGKTKYSSANEFSKIRPRSIRPRSIEEIVPERNKIPYEFFKKWKPGGLHFEGSGAPFWCLFGGSGASRGFLGASREPPWGVFGVLGPPGASWAPPGGLLGASCGDSWVPPGRVLGPLDGSRWRQDGPRGPHEGFLGAS